MGIRKFIPGLRVLIHLFALPMSEALAPLHATYAPYQLATNLTSTTNEPIHEARMWANITPSTDLTWTSCYGKEDLFCSRLIAPLDHDNSTDDRTVQLAIVKLEVPNAKRTVFVNPGGPGSDPIGILLYSKDWRAAVGNDSDLVAIVPRGISFTLPAITCGDAQSYYDKAFIDGHDVNHSNATISHAWDSGVDLGARCRNSTYELLPFVGTAHTARDMDFIRRAMELDELDYYGASYGTILGMTYAQLFPHNVGRMVLSGVLDILTLFQPTHEPRAWLGDEYEGFSTLYQSCHNAGPTACRLWDRSVETIRVKFEKASRMLDEEAFVTDDVSFTSLDFRKFVNVAFHGITEFFPLVLQAAFEVLSGEPGPALNPIMFPRNPPPDALPPTEEPLRDARNNTNSNKGAYWMILCSDTGGFAQYPGMSYLKEEVDAFANAGEPASFLGRNIGVMLECQAANLPAVARPRSEDFRNISTSNPILFVANTADPLTPKWNAKRARAYAFPNSGLLTVDGTGHCSAADPHNICAEQWIAPYFATGELPPEGIICDGLHKEEVAKEFVRYAKRNHLVTEHDGEERVDAVKKDQDRSHHRVLDR